MIEEYMCPNCVTPWKCNGSHIEPIQRYDYSGVLANTDVNVWVSYTDHVAKVEAMRAAFIAAVEELRDTWGNVVVLDDALAAMREVQP